MLSPFEWWCRNFILPDICKPCLFVFLRNLFYLTILSVPIGTVQWIYATSIKKLRRSLTALTSLVIIFGGGFGYQLVQYFQTPAEVPGDIGINSIPAVEPTISPWLILFLVLFLSAAAACILFLKFSDRIPTKRLAPRIRLDEPQNGGDTKEDLR